MRHLGFARQLAWVALVAVVIFSAVLSTYIGNHARDILIAKQRNFAALLAENLNAQIYRRYTLPTLIGFGEINPKHPAQYQQLDQVVQSTTHDLNVSELRIFNHDGTVSYSMNKEDLEKAKPAEKYINEAGQGQDIVFKIDSALPYWKAFFHFPLPPHSFVLHTAYPLRIENRLSSSDATGPAIWVLEFSQDITADMERALRFQQLIIVLTVVSASVLFGMLLLFIRRAENAMAVRMQEEQRLLLELHQNEKLAGMGRVIASIAHEIRNPLGIIRSSAELLLKRNAGGDSSTSRILQAIYDEARRLSQTVSDFLDYARPQRPKSSLVDVSSVISKALVFLEPDLQTREILVCHNTPPDHPLFVMGDSDLLYRAFYNIMGNAVQAMQHTGTLTIGLHEEMDDTHPMVVVTFTDSGPGFPEEHLERLLDPFFTPKDDGTGLGLPIVNNIIVSHDGFMTLVNAPEGGARVTISLPSHPAATA